MKFKILKIIPPLFISFLFSVTANAGVVIGGTRLIYNEGSSQSSISINNPDNKPYLIQSWITKSSDKDDNDNTFVSTPPIFKLEPKSQNSVRIVYTGKPLPKDRESVFWLNIKSIPSTDPNAQNQLLITVNSKMKLFYRPSGLNGAPGEAYKELKFTQKNGLVTISNPSSYNVSIYQILFDGRENKEITMIPAKGYITVHSAHYKNVKWSSINDFGSITTALSKNIE
ncbi:fimbrial biogenesis chaperone [Rosenbergiella epipactidis]|uniref:fimbrial biogenesis chaperone n=1 Tax=Rosenbergiella epipactidis TaxID=1544694 RepID=UPI001F4E4363|nr:molecular chaperone [Rosenbergiella epipactidis]